MMGALELALYSEGSCHNAKPSHSDKRKACRAMKARHGQK